MGILELGERQRVRLFVRRPVRTLPLLPRSAATRPLQHTGEGKDPADPRGGFRRRQRPLQRPPLRVRPGEAPLRDPDTGARLPDVDVREIEARLVEATLVGRRSLRRARRASRRGGGHRAVRPVRRCVPRRLPRGLHATGSRPRHPAHRAAGPRGRSGVDPVPAASRRATTSSC